MKHRHPPHLFLARCAARFARKHGISLPSDAADPVADLGRLLLAPAHAHLRGQWLARVQQSSRRHGFEPPVLSRGRSNPCLRFLAAEGLTPGVAVPPDEASRIVARWDATLRRVLGRPADPVWRFRWWADRDQAYQVTLAFAGDGSAIVGYWDRCGRKCANVCQSRASRPHIPQKLADAHADPACRATRDVASDSATRDANPGGATGNC